MSALTRNRAPNTVPSDLMAEYYVQRTLGGAGLIVSEGILVTRQGYVHCPCVYEYVLKLFILVRTEWSHAPGIWNSEQTEAWKKIVDAVHSKGGRIYAQLWHGKGI